jgi:hypothetical protein
MPFPIVLIGIAEFSNTPSCPPLIVIFLPLLSFFYALHIAIDIHSSDLSIPNMSKHSPSSFI